MRREREGERDREDHHGSRCSHFTSPLLTLCLLTLCFLFSVLLSLLAPHHFHPSSPLPYRLHHESELQDLADRYEEEMQRDVGGGQQQSQGQGPQSDGDAHSSSSGDGSSTTAAAPVLYSGWLKKKSPKKYAGMQVRDERREA